MKLSVNETKWSSLLGGTSTLTLYISIWIFDFGPEKLPGLSRNRPQVWKRMWKWQILVFLVWRTGRYTPTKNSQEYPRRGPVCDYNTNKKLPNCMAFVGIRYSRRKKWKKKKKNSTHTIYPCHRKVTSDRGRSKWNVTWARDSIQKNALFNVATLCKINERLGCTLIWTLTSCQLTLQSPTLS